VNKNKKILIVIVHIAAWLCFFALPYIFFPKPKDLPLSISQRILVQNICINAFLVAFYYINTLILIPKLLFKKKGIWYLSSIIGFFILFLYIPREITNLIIPPETIPFRSQFHQAFNDTLANNRTHMPRYRGGPGGGRFTFIPWSSSIFILVLTIGTCISVMQQWRVAEQTRKEVETEKLNTELSFLKSQINPHFFFNTLNNIYSLAVVGSNETATAIMKLSSIMRYILTDTQLNLVPVENEINFIKNYIDLQLVRLTDKVKVLFTTSGDIQNKQVAPLLFIPFVENAFKYGVSAKAASSINIDITVSGDLITFTSDNDIVKSDSFINETTGIGINNVKRRLELLYPGKYTLNASEVGNTFKVHLTIYTR
jgi:hypothetical protein